MNGFEKNLRKETGPGNGQTLSDLFDLSDKEEKQIRELGHALYHDGRVEEALKIFSGLVALRPERSDYWISLGATLLRLERYDEARPVFTLASRMNPGDVAAWTGLGECEVALGNMKEAAEAFETALELDPDGETDAGRRARALVYGLAQFFDRLQQIAKEP